MKNQKKKIVFPQSFSLPAGHFAGRLHRIRHLRQRLLPRRPRRRGTATADSGCTGGVDESSIKSKNIPTIFLQITGEWPGLSFVFRKSGINTNEIYG